MLLSDKSVMQDCCALISEVLNINISKINVHSSHIGMFYNKPKKDFIYATLHIINKYDKHRLLKIKDLILQRLFKESNKANPKMNNSKLFFVINEIDKGDFYSF